MSSLLTSPTASSRAAGLLFAPIATDLAAVERVYAETVAHGKPGLARLIQHLDQYRGKRLRPVLLLLTAHACGRVTPTHHVLGAVVEMVHTATLVHDDVLDEAGLRRHVPTVNAGWGNKASILLGDYLFTHAFHLSSTTGDARACELIGEATNRVCEGELQQTLERGNLSLSEEEYLEIIDKKTAALTACCCQLGAYYAEAEPEVVERLANYGRSLGIAFQVADDLLDITGREQTAGKTLGTDLEQLKLTLPLIHMLENVRPEEATRLRALLRGRSPQRREAITEAVETTKAVAYARQKADDFAAAARDELECLPPSDFRSILETLTHWSVRREK
ncbi:MAG TPA: polyprenyl synthetase family protein [Gemmataceae bacterium]|jgi:octaprenyl-diphosphate synthase|nr:polyprenyl synthetase family protein [Gemmataceae bacterium]